MRRLSIGNWFNTAAGIAHQFSTEQEGSVSACLREVRLKAHSAVTKPLNSRNNKKAIFAEDPVLWTEKNWSKVHFRDENKFNLFGSDGKHYVQHQTGERLNPEQVKKSVKGGGGSVMLWVCFVLQKLSWYTATWQSERKCLSEPRF